MIRTRIATLTASAAAAAAVIGAAVPAAATANTVTTVSPGTSVLTVSRLVGNVADGRGCTVGFIGNRPDGSQVGLYAGHCGSAGQQVVIDGRIAGVNVASSAPVLTADDRFVDPNAPDWGIFSLDPQVAQAAAGGAVRPAAVGTAAPGDPVCSQGVTSGWRCGTVLSVSNGYIATTIPVQVGDSGGPLVRSTDNAALGIASRAASFSGPSSGNGSLFYDLRSALDAAGISLSVA